MIRIRVTRREGRYEEFLSSGHADFAEEGLDIVCAAVSALIITTVNALETFTEERFSLEERDGFVKLVFEGEQTPEGRLLMDSLLLGLTEIQENYSDQYLTVKIREV